MIISNVILGMGLFLGVSFIAYFVFKKISYQVSEQSECFVLRFGKLERTLQTPGLYWLPQKLLPWYDIVSVSKQIDYLTFKGIQVNDCFGTTVVVDLWIEFRVSNAYRALFSVENWEEVLESAVIHATASILCSQSVEEILKHRSELSERLQQSIATETERWGITLQVAMVQNIGLLPEVSKQFFQSVAAKIDRTTALIKEEGRLNVAKLEAATARKVAELNGLTRSQLPLEMGQFYHTLSADPIQLKKFTEYWELMNLNPKKTITFSGFTDDPLGMVEATKAMESVLTH